MEELNGYIEQIIFNNPENGYTVFVLSTDTEEITCVGSFAALSEGECVALKGERVVHPVYGEQIKVNSLEVKEPTDSEAVLRYLSSGAVKGVGEALAKRIVKMFGDDTFRVIEEEPELLVKVKGISERKAREIAEQVVEKQDLRKIMIFLQGFGISNNLAMKIYAHYGNLTISILNENPYKLAEDIDGVGFKTADEIAINSGLLIDPEYRIKSGILYTISMSYQEGHIYLPMDELIERSKELLDADREHLKLSIENLSIENKLIVKTINDETRVYSKKMYYLELDSARRLIDLKGLAAIDKGIDETLLKIAKAEGMEIDSVQLNAAKDAIINCVSVITGGPGTGKTTTINLILKYFEYENNDIFLTAPTGRAAKRMTETTGYEASTIQRLLGFGKNTDREGFGFEKNESNPLEADAVVVDEMSMVDLPTFNALLRAIMPGTRLIMVGDVNQLPSVGPGAVLSDIIGSGCFKTTVLNRIYRQDEQSDIIVNAHMINEGKIPDIKKKSNDFFFLEREDINVTLKHMVMLITQKLPPYVDATSFDIQVLTPMRKGVVGANALNPILQQYLNPPSKDKAEKEVDGVIFREGDKVMQIKNNYQLEWEIKGKYGIAYDSGVGVFNGDMGIIKSINTFREIVEVRFDDGRSVDYPFSCLDELEMAYAVTIHKSQGSEYPAVIIPLLSGHKLLMNRNLLYTGLTRAKKTAVFLGKREIFEQMVNNTEARKRYSGLIDALKEIDSY